MKLLNLIIIFFICLCSYEYSFSQMVGPTEVCQYSRHCYNSPANCSGNGFLYTCKFDVSGGSWVNANVGCCGACGERSVDWLQPGFGTLHFYRQTLFGQVHYDHHYLNVTIQPCVKGCEDHWILPQLQPLIFNGIYEASDYIEIGGSPGYLGVAGYSQYFTAENYIEINGEFLAGFGGDFAFGISPCLFQLREASPDSVNDEALLDSALIFSCPIDSIIFGDSTLQFSSYLWDFGNGDTSTSTFPKVYYSSPGTYLVSVIMIDSLNDTTILSHNIVIEDCGNLKTSNHTGTLDDAGIKISLMGDELILFSDVDKIKRISIYDINGILLIESDGSAYSREIDLSMIASGIYIIHIQTEKFSFFEKIVNTH